MAAKFAFKSETHCSGRRSSHGDAGSISIDTGYSSHVVYWKLKNCIYTLGNIAYVIWTRTNEILGVVVTRSLASMWPDFNFKTRCFYFLFPRCYRFVPNIHPKNVLAKGLFNFAKTWTCWVLALYHLWDKKIKLSLKNWTLFVMDILMYFQKINIVKGVSQLD